MSITYRQHWDTRDGKIYNCVLMPDGKWWSAENLAYFTSDSKLVNGSDANTQLHGRLYRKTDAVANSVPGSHIPTRLELKTMLDSLGLGITNYDSSINADICAALRSSDYGGLDSFGFNLRASGRFLAAGYNIYDGFGTQAWMFASDYVSYSVYIALFYSTYGSLTSATEEANWLTTRFIVDVFTEPVPPTKINGTFSGSGVRAFMSIKSLGGTLEITIASQTTSSLTIDLTFIETWGKQSGPVQIMVVDGEYISEWIDWEFK